MTPRYVGKKRFMISTILAGLFILTLTAGAGVAQASTTIAPEIPAKQPADAGITQTATATTFELQGSDLLDATASDSTTGETATEGQSQTVAPDLSSNPAFGETGNQPPANTATLAAAEGGATEGQNSSADVYGASPSVLPALGADSWLGPDYNGDGSTELTFLYDLGSDTAGLYVFDPAGAGYAAPRRVWTSAPGTWDWRRSKMVTTDFNGDNNTEITVLYDLGSDTAGLYVFDPTASGYGDPRRVWVSDPGTWDWRRSKVTTGDYNGDNCTEVTVLYDLGSDTAGLYVFDTTASGFAAPRRVWTSAPGSWDWRRSKMVTGDHDGDNRTEVTVLYDLGSDTAGLYLFDPTASGYAAPQRVWTSAPGSWDWRRSKVIVADHDGDSRTEVTVLYDLSYDTAGLYLFEPDSTAYTAPVRVWTSAPGSWDWRRSKLMAGDHDGDGRTEVTVLYDLCYDTAGLYLFEPDSTAYTAPARVWTSAPGSWDWRRSKTTEDQFTPKVTYLGMAWIDINLSRQVLTAIALIANEIAEGYSVYTTQAIFSTLIATGAPGMDTPSGTFYVYSKNVAIDMSGPGYYAPNVPFVLWFTGPYSIHGTYWHNSFGYPHSHGCVNLPTPAANWLFDRTPVGMPVLVHY